MARPRGVSILSPLLTATVEWNGNTLMKGPKERRERSYLVRGHMMQEWMTSRLHWDAAITTQEHVECSCRQSIKIRAGPISVLGASHDFHLDSPQLTA
jgi:hypothetical protein